MGRPETVEIKAEMRFPWRDGRRPGLVDVVVPTSTTLVGIESERYEPFRPRQDQPLFRSL